MLYLGRLQEVTVADTELEPGLYWAAIQGDEATTVTIYDQSSFPRGGIVQTSYYDRAGGY